MGPQICSKPHRPKDVYEHLIPVWEPTVWGPTASAYRVWARGATHCYRHIARSSMIASSPGATTPNTYATGRVGLR